MILGTHCAIAVAGERRGGYFTLVPHSINIFVCLMPSEKLQCHKDTKFIES